MLPLNDEDDSLVRLKHHQKVLCGALKDSQFEETQVISSGEPQSLIPATPTRNSKNSRLSGDVSFDPTTNVVLDYNYSMVELEDTQPDTGNFLMIPSTGSEPQEPNVAIPVAKIGEIQSQRDLPAASSPQTTPTVHRTPADVNVDYNNVMEDMHTACETPFTFFPETEKFATAETPRRKSAPQNDFTPNPLAQLLGDSKPFSLSQAFVASSPMRRPRISIYSQTPPTPSIHAASIMAKSMPKLSMNQNTTPTRQSPMEVDLRRKSREASTSPPKSPTKAGEVDNKMEGREEAVKAHMGRKLSDVWSTRETEQTRKPSWTSRYRLSPSKRTEYLLPISSSPPEGQPSDTADKSDDNQRDKHYDNGAPCGTEIQHAEEREDPTNISTAKTPKKSRLLFSGHLGRSSPAGKQKVPALDIDSEDEIPLPPIPNTSWAKEDEREKFKRLVSQADPDPRTRRENEGLAWHELGMRKKSTFAPNSPLSGKNTRVSRRSPPLQPNLPLPRPEPIFHEDVIDSKKSVMQIPASDPPETAISDLQHGQFGMDAYLERSLNQLPSKRILRCTKPTTALSRPNAIVPQEHNRNISSDQYSPQVGTVEKPIPLAQLPPFNIPAVAPPTPPRRNGESATMPDMIRESSNLLAQLEPPNSLTPGPSSDLIGPETSTREQESLTSCMEPPRTPSSTHLNDTQWTRKGATTIPATSPWVDDRLVSPDRRLQTAHSTSGLDINFQDNNAPLLKQKRLIKSSPAEGSGDVEMTEAAQNLSSEYSPMSPRAVPDEQEVEIRASKRRKTLKMVKQKSQGVTAPIEKGTTEMTSRDGFPAKSAKSAKPSTAFVQTTNDRISGKHYRKKLLLSHQKRKTPKEAPGINNSASSSLSDVPRSDSASHTGSLPPLPPISVPARVFALFKDKNLYYHPATVLSSISPSQIRVSFDDQTESTLERTCVRPLDLRIGDTVRVDLPNMKRHLWVIKAFPTAGIEKAAIRYTDIRGRKSVFVALKSNEKKSESNGLEAPRVEVPVTNIYLPQSLWGQFARRDSSSFRVPLFRAGNLLQHNPSTEVQNRRTATPLGNIFAGAITPVRTVSAVTTPRSDTVSGDKIGASCSGIFANMVFMLSFGDKEAEKTKLQKLILSNGGKILESTFEDLFAPYHSTLSLSTSLSSSMSSTPSAPTPAPITNTFTLLPQYQNLGFAAVISTTHSRRTKFLEALSLSVPCLHPRWIHDSLRSSKPLSDIETYLLPAGESSYLGPGVIRSRHLPAFDPMNVSLVKMLESRPKLLDGKRVLIIQSPKDVDKKRIVRFLLRAIGAKVVKPVKLTEVEGVMKAGGWDIVVAENVKMPVLAKVVRMTGAGGESSVRIVDEETIVQSLILGKWAV
ncbi:hypothetical protein EX30DRAFT_395700 [Ascodesmis nigricans]|uniref:BRCT domain-containing protein n=1 Tax=Ascodesmis nigricans TaxID=341454 RepID=A0A4S2MX87_9PEZI|nr:hypothetical protein EX30DRAFT_395700 [Ascodesmis nigricans]